jgi:hypothetical protein
VDTPDYALLVSSPWKTLEGWKLVHLVIRAQSSGKLRSARKLTLAEAAEARILSVLAVLWERQFPGRPQFPAGEFQIDAAFPTLEVESFDDLLKDMSNAIYAACVRAVESIGCCVWAVSAKRYGALVRFGPFSQQPKTEAHENISSNSGFVRLLEPVPDEVLLAKWQELMQCGGQEQSPDMPKPETSPNESTFQQKEEQRRAKLLKTKISTAEFTQAEERTAKDQEPLIERFQAFLDDLAGRKSDSPEDNKWVAWAVYDLARRRGIELTCNEQVVDLRWHGRVFEARAIGAGRTAVCASATFPKLIAQAPKAR